MKDTTSIQSWGEETSQLLPQYNNPSGNSVPCKVTSKLEFESVSHAKNGYIH